MITLYYTDPSAVPIRPDRTDCAERAREKEIERENEREKERERERMKEGERERERERMKERERRRGRGREREGESGLVLFAVRDQNPDTNETGRCWAVLFI